MKKYFLILMSSVLIVFTGFFTGYVSKEGEILKQYLTSEKLKELIDSSDDSIWIIDVRPSSSYIAGHIPTARSFPSSDILSRLDEIPMDKYLIIYCETGGRAQVVIKMLAKKGYTKMMNWGSYKKWKYEYVKGEK